MKQSNIKNLLLLLFIIIAASCNSNKGNNKKEENNNKYTYNIEKKCNDVIKNNKSVDENLVDEKNSFSRNQKKHNPKAIELNNIAMESVKYIISPTNSKDTLILAKAIEILDQAIKIDSLYNLAFTNKAVVLKRLNKEKEALQVLRIITKRKPNYAEGFSMLGFTYEKLGNIDSANIQYKSAIIAYSYRIKNTDNINDKINRAFIMSLIDREKGLCEINHLIKNLPEDKTIAFYKLQLFDEFDREEFIRNQ